MELSKVKVGSRILFQERPWYEERLTEATLLEFSPTKTRMKLKYLGGCTCWKKVSDWLKDYELLEVLEAEGE